MIDDAGGNELDDLRDAVRLLAIAALEPGRFTFELQLLTLEFSSEQRAGARVVVDQLLGAALGESPRVTWAGDAPVALRRFGQEYRPGEVVDRERAEVILARALDIHPDAARRLLQAHKDDGKGLEGHAALDSPTESSISSTSE